MPRAATLVVILAFATPAGAQALRTRFGATVGYRTELGALGERYTHGWSLGIVAGASIGFLGFVLSFQRSAVYSSSPANFDNSVFLVEAAATLRPRLRLRGEANALFGQVSLDLVRASFPIDPDQSQSYIGPSVGFGGEFGLGAVNVGALVKYGLLFGGPKSVQIVFMVTTGLR